MGPELLERRADVDQARANDCPPGKEADELDAIIAGFFCTEGLDVLASAQKKGRWLAGRFS